MCVKSSVTYHILTVGRGALAWRIIYTRTVVGILLAMSQCCYFAMSQCRNVTMSQCRNVERKGGDNFCRYAEMDKDAKNKISHRRRALDKVRKHFFDEEYAIPISLLSQRPDTS